GNASPAGVPVPVVLFAVAAAATAVLLNWRRLGLLMTLVGANPVAAQFSGIRALSVLVGTYVASGLLAALAGVIIIARTASATPDYGQSRSEEHTSELQSRENLVCRLLLEKKKKIVSQSHVATLKRNI